MTLRSWVLSSILVSIHLGGCASTGTTPTVALGQPVVMMPGERVQLPSRANLRYVAVAADSRCPPNVQCIQAGDADVVFEFTPAAASTQRITLNTAAQPATTPLGDWQLRLIALGFGAAPTATVQVDRAR